MASSGILPRGLAIFHSIPDLLYVPELVALATTNNANSDAITNQVCGGAVWILIACTNVRPYDPLAYDMVASIFCFTLTFALMMLFLCGFHHNRHIWVIADVLYHSLAALLYISISVLIAYITAAISRLEEFDYEQYKLDIAATVMSFITTLLYIIHAIYSAIRWKSA